MNESPLVRPHVRASGCPGNPPGRPDVPFGGYDERTRVHPRPGQRDRRRHRPRRRPPRDRGLGQRLRRPARPRGEHRLLRPRRAARAAPGRRAVAPSSRTSPRSSTASCASSGSCWSGSGPRAPSRTPRTRWPSWPCSPRRPARRCSTRSTSAGRAPTPRRTSAAARSRGSSEIVQATGADTVILDGELAPSQLQEPRGPGQGQGRRPHRADPRHLRPAREVQGGPGPGRAGPAQLHEAAAARLGWQPLPPGRWPGRLARAAASVAVVPVRPRSRPTAAGSTPRSPSSATSSSTCGPPATPSAPTGSGTRSRRWRSRATPTPASPRCSTG